MSVLESGSRLLQRFSSAKGGNVGVIFAVTLTPIIVAVGSSVDYGRALNERTRMQSALDAATIDAARAYANGYASPLAVGNSGASTLLEAARKSYADTSSDGAKGTVDTAQVVDTTVVTTASAQIETTFLGVAGINSLDISVDSTAQMAGRDMELSVMLDVTGSMGNDMDDLKLASEDLLDIVLTKTSKKRRVGIVPFAHAINVGSYFDAVVDTSQLSYWNDSDGDGWADGMSNNLKKANKCPRWKTRNKKKYNKKCKKYEPQQITISTSTCVTERSGNYYDREDAPTSSNKKFPIYDFSRDNSPSRNMSSQSCRPSNVPILPLTDNRSNLEDTIDRMQASGYTAGHLGTAWAWYMLSPQWSGIWGKDHEPAPYDKNETLKVAILMSDGEYNTYYINGRGNSWQQARDVCAEMKAAGVEIYSIGFDMRAGSSTDTLKQCASSDDHYFFPYDGDALRRVFAKIGGRIALAADGITLAD